MAVAPSAMSNVMFELGTSPRQRSESQPDGNGRKIEATPDFFNDPINKLEIKEADIR